MNSSAQPQPNRWKAGQILSLLLLGAGVALIFSLDDRSRHLPLMSGYAMATIGFIWAMAFRWDSRQLFTALAAALGFRAFSLFAPAILSDDWYRFVYDGRLVLEGVNPFTVLPSEDPGRSPDLYPLLNSQQYYSVYPPLLQGLFALAVAIGGSVKGAVLVLRLIILLFEAGSLRLLFRLLPAGRKKLVLLYALCPLVIVEMTGGIHFEAIMTFFVLLSAWLISQKKSVLAGLALGGAIAAKLLPLLFVPLLLPVLGWKKGSLAIVLAVGAAALTFLPFWEPATLQKILSSTELYFVSFEFNGGLYNVLKMVCIQIQGWNSIAVSGPLLSAVGTVLMALVALWRFPDDHRALLTTAGLMFSTYQFFSTTVHPWYLAPLVALLSLSHYRFALIWALLIPLTYVSYRTEGVYESQLIIGLEHGIVLAFLLGESIWETPLGLRMRRICAEGRANIKLARLWNWIRPSESILDIGPGNGAVVKAWIEQGNVVEPLDVVDKSLFKEVRPTLYRGKVMPYADSSYDTAILLTMLHHCPDPDAVLREAVRVSRTRVIVMEDVYRGALMEKLTWWMDSLVNMEWTGHPHSNKSEEQWEALFSDLGLRILSRRRDRVLGIFRQTTWDLVKVKQG